jgi:hypothetical protein
MLSPSRSGGALDPLGKRAVDFWRADDLVGCVEALQGRWLFLTLTINRAAWTCPEAAYQRCNERVRRVLSGLGPHGIWFAAVEMQEKTGDGWPHWHGLVWVPDSRSIEEVKAEALSLWRVVTEHVDTDTGEVQRSIESIGFIDVQECRDSKGAAKYVAKYIVKPWNAVPEWLLVSRRRLRCVRFSSRAYDVLEKLGRHVRHRGSRKPRTGRGRPARTVLQRMGRSGSMLNGFRRVAGSWKYAGTVPVPISAVWEICEGFGGRVVRGGVWGKVRAVVAPGDFERLRTAAASDAFADRRSEWVKERMFLVRSAWLDRQEFLARGGGGVVDGDDRRL